MTTLTNGTRLQRPGKEIFITVVGTEDNKAVVRFEDGKEAKLSFTTLNDKRKWLVVEATQEPEVEEVPIVEEEPKKVEKKATTKKATKTASKVTKFHDFDFDLKYYLEMNDFEVKTWEKLKGILSAKKDGKRVCEIRIRNTKVHVYTHKANENSVELEKPDCGFKFRTTFEYGTNEQALLTAIKDILA